MFDLDPLLEFEMFLRDSRMVEVIISLDRLAVLPADQLALNNAVQDMSRLKSFINDNLPSHLQEAASAVFSEHADAMKSHYTLHHDGGELKPAGTLC